MSVSQFCSHSCFVTGEIFVTLRLEKRSQPFRLKNPAGIPHRKRLSPSPHLLHCALVAPVVLSFMLVEGVAAAAGPLFPGAQYTAGTRPTCVAVADLDGDGDADFAVANWESENVSVLLNDGGGTFAAHGTCAAGVSPRS
ncbi:MAG: hypothetical protein JSV19_04875, partial [Phycisphaerales bacterium]